MSTEHLDVLIVGAGLSGVGAGVHLQRECPGKSFAILEAREAMGGTWDLFRYPGIRSDSDMYTLGYDFEPWPEKKAIADGPSILNYINRTARQYGVADHIRYHHRVTRAEWSSEHARWTVHVERGEQKQPAKLTCRFLYACSGYYNYEQGYAPEFKGVDAFVAAGGQVVHPQKWPKDLDYAGKRVVIIGSGATAVTLAPSMSEKAAHVTMLQRTPTYILNLPSQDAIANFLRKVLPARAQYWLVRWKNVFLSWLVFTLSRRTPGFMKRLIGGGVRRELGPDYDMKHFRPPYQPWDQRLCLVPDSDLFRAIREGRVSMATDHIDTFTEKGLRMKSGQELEADLVVTATGLNMQLFGGASLCVDGAEINPPDTLVYRGVMISGIPNFGIAVGYTNASWTLKCDLCTRYFCRVIRQLDRQGMRQFTPRTRGVAPAEAVIDLKSGYVTRALPTLPRQGAGAPWKLYQNYALDLLTLRYGSLNDGFLEFSNPPPGPLSQAA